MRSCSQCSRAKGSVTYTDLLSMCSYPLRDSSHRYVSPFIGSLLSDLPPLQQALSHLRECEILHGDLKPDNILYSCRDGTLVVLDLGVGEDLKGSLLATGFRGTHQFSAPEVGTFDRAGSPVEYGFDADTFSAGRVLEYLLERVPEPTEPGDWVSSSFLFP